MRCLRTQTSCGLKLHQNRALLSRPAVARAIRCLDPTRSLSGDPALSVTSELRWTIYHMLPDRSYLSQWSSLLSLQMLLEIRAGHTLPHRTSSPIQAMSPQESGHQVPSLISYPFLDTIPRYLVWLLWNQGRIAVSEVK